MLAKMIGAFILLGFFIQAIDCGVCPSPDEITPCTCTNTTIRCDANGTEIDIVQVFEAIRGNYSHGQQQFEYFALGNTSKELLPYDMFRGVLIEKIFFWNNPNLTCVHPNAFVGNESNIVTTWFASTENTSFTSSNATCNIFTALTMLNKLDRISLYDSDVEELQANTINMNSDKGHFLIQGHDRTRGSLKTIRSNAFSDLKDIKRITLTRNQISRIESNAFDLPHPSDIPLDIILSHNDLSGDSFGDNAFNVGNRTTMLSLSQNPKLKYLNETVFRPLLANRQTGQIVIRLLGTWLEYNIKTIYG